MSISVIVLQNAYVNVAIETSLLGSLALINPVVRLVGNGVISSGGICDGQPGCSEHSCVNSSWVRSTLHQARLVY